jgi:signal transduction histidine kinase
LAGIGLLSDILADKLQERQPAEAVDARHLAELVNNANRETRAVARGLFPVRLEENGLASALEELCENTATRFKINCPFECREPVVVRDHSAAQHLYFIAQEAITNAVKHGKARQIKVALERSSDGRCALVVRNDGGGFVRTPEKARGMGIRIMQYRARVIGATLEIKPLAESGAEVSCRFVCESENNFVDAKSFH